MKQVKVTILSHVWRVLLTLQSDACPQLITVVDHHASLFTAPRLVQPVLRVQNSVDSNSGTLLHTSPFYAEQRLQSHSKWNQVRPEPDCTHRRSCTHGLAPGQTSILNSHSTPTKPWTHTFQVSIVRLVEMLSVDSNCCKVECHGSFAANTVVIGAWRCTCNLLVFRTHRSVRQKPSCRSIPNDCR
jgi:hypothetical protein